MALEFRCCQQSLSHLLVSYNKKNIGDEEGNRTNAVDPHGMSGGGLFVADVSKVLASRGSDGLTPKLAGLLIEFREPESVVIATRFGPIFSVISRLYGQEPKMS